MKFFKKRIIGPKDNPLLTRYIIFRFPWIGVYVHHLMRSDYDRACHDHPWGFISIILSGSYVEHTPQGHKIYRRGRILFRPAMWLHWLEMHRPMWTLVIVGRRTRRWGFLLDGKWCWWRKYNYEKAICEEEILWDEGGD